MKNGRKLRRIFRAVFTAAAICAFAAVMLFSFKAFRNLSDGYRAMKHADLSADYSGEISYDDHLYASVGYGVVLDSTVENKEASMRSFLDSSLRLIDRRIFSAGLVYTMLITALLVFPICEKHRDDRGGMTVGIWVSAILIYLLYLGGIFGLHKYFGIPFHIPGIRALVFLFVGFISVLGGNFVLAILISRPRRAWLKIAFGILAVPAVYALFLFSFLFEAGLYSEPYIESFDYVAEIDDRVLDENFEGAYYDGEKNVLVVDGTEYEPQTVENPEHFTGKKRTGAIVYEMLDPYSGNSLDMVQQALDTRFGPVISLLYAVKGMFWMLLGIRGFREEE